MTNVEPMEPDEMKHRHTDRLVKRINEEIQRQMKDFCADNSFVIHPHHVLTLWDSIFHSIRRKDLMYAASLFKRYGWTITMGFYKDPYGRYGDSSEKALGFLFTYDDEEYNGRYGIVDRTGDSTEII